MDPMNLILIFPGDIIHNPMLHMRLDNITSVLSNQIASNY